MTKHNQSHRYIYSFDGLRAFAVLSVIFYHFHFNWAKGGFLGVDVFFVLSGYLITSLLLPIEGDTVKVNLREFWLRRIRRLIPAAYLMIIVTFVFIILFHREILETVRGDAISSIFYVSNWWFIFHQVSYFDSFNALSPSKNLWSLAIEEQFYFIWPILFILGLKIFKKRQKFSLAIFTVAICSAILMAILYVPGSDPSRVYYGTDTRAFELLIGSSLAFIWPMKRLSTQKITEQGKTLLNIAGFISFSLFILSVFFVDEFQSFLYQGGMFLFSLNIAVLIACISHPSSFLGKILSIKPLHWLGTRSYSIYLWHYPITVLSTPMIEIGNPSYLRISMQIVVIFIIAELSYRLIETPIRKYGFRTFFSEHFTIYIFSKRMAFTKKFIFTSLSFSMLFVFTIGITGALGSSTGAAATDKQSKQEQPLNNQQVAIDSAKVEKPSVNKEEDHAKVNNERIENQVQSKTPESMNKNNSSTNDSKDSVSQISQRSYKDLIMIGDSITLDIQKALLKKYPNMIVDGKVGRQVADAIHLIPSYQSYNHSESAIIIELGTNGFFTNKQIDTLLDAFSNAHIYLVNTRVPRQWENKVNKVLEEKSKERMNVTLIDWHSQAIQHPEYFETDGVHLRPKGIEALTTLIFNIIERP